MSPTAQALGSLRNLEELFLPTGDGIRQAAKLIVQQCLKLQCLRVLVFHYTLDDDSVMEIGEFASEKGFPLCASSDVIGAACCKCLEVRRLPESSSIPLLCCILSSTSADLDSTWSDWKGSALYLLVGVLWGVYV